MSPRTMYDIRSEPSDWMYLGDPGPSMKGPALMIMGIPARTVDWIPDGIVIVTDHFDESPPEYFKGVKLASGTFTSPGTFTSKVYDEMTKWWKPLSDYKLTFDDTSLTTSTGTSIGFSTPSRSLPTYKWDTETGGWGLETGTPLDTFTSKGGTIFFGHPTTSGAATPESQSPEEWSDPVEESQEPDPDSIFGKALAKARAEVKK